MLWLHLYFIPLKFKILWDVHAGHTTSNRCTQNIHIYGFGAKSFISIHFRLKVHWIAGSKRKYFQRLVTRRTWENCLRTWENKLTANSCLQSGFCDIWIMCNLYILTFFPNIDHIFFFLSILQRDIYNSSKIFPLTFKEISQCIF